MADVVLHDIACKYRVQAWDRGAVSESAFEHVTGVKWPLSVGAVAEGRCRVFCIGPAEWIVIGMQVEPSSLRQTFGRLPPESGWVAVDVSAGLVGVTLPGPRAREIISQVCGLDLHPSAFPPGSCSRTRVAQVPVILRCDRDSGQFDCYVSKSYHFHLLSWLRIL